MADLVLSVCAATAAEAATVILNRKTNVFFIILFLLYFLCYLPNAFCQTSRNLISIARVKLNVSHSCQWLWLRLSSRLNTHAIDARNFSQRRKKKQINCCSITKRVNAIDIGCVIECVLFASSIFLACFAFDVSAIDKPISQMKLGGGIYE